MEIQIIPVLSLIATGGVVPFIWHLIVRGVNTDRDIAELKRQAAQSSAIAVVAASLDKRVAVMEAAVADLRLLTPELRSLAESMASVRTFCEISTRRLELIEGKVFNIKKHVDK